MYVFFVMVRWRGKLIILENYNIKNISLNYI